MRLGFIQESRSSGGGFATNNNSTPGKRKGQVNTRRGDKSKVGDLRRGTRRERVRYVHLSVRHRLADDSLDSASSSRKEQVARGSSEGQEFHASQRSFDVVTRTLS